MSGIILVCGNIALNSIIKKHINLRVTTLLYFKVVKTMIKVGKVGLKRNNLMVVSFLGGKTKGDYSTLLLRVVSVRFISNFQLTRKWG